MEISPLLESGQTFLRLDTEGDTQGSENTGRIKRGLEKPPL
jgi:hypothetical protein